jgi:hypothetical protein
MTVPCPWYVTAHAVDRYAALTGRRAPRGSPAWDDISDELIERCAAIWARYEGNPELRPGVSKTGAYVYRGAGSRGRVTVVVSMERRPEGPKPQVVDVASVESDRAPRKRTSPSDERRRAARAARKGAT